MALCSSKSRSLPSPKLGPHAKHLKCVVKCFIGTKDLWFLEAKISSNFDGKTRPRTFLTCPLWWRDRLKTSQFGLSGWTSTSYTVKGSLPSTFKADLSHSAGNLPQPWKPVLPSFCFLSLVETELPRKWKGGNNFIFQSVFHFNLRLTKGRVDLGRAPLSRRHQEESAIQSGKDGQECSEATTGKLQNTDAHSAVCRNVPQSAIPRPAWAAPF